jgi:exosortase A-associated hydrolase 2
VLWQPPHGTICRFAALYVPAALDEMNKSRRMAALQARALANCGGAVALLDPTGTGDSAGEHGEATWNGWRTDVTLAWEWLGHLAPVPRVLWGMRLGGLLAADLVASGAIDPSLLLLWQPVISGRAFFNQLLRLGSARELIAGVSSGADAKLLRESLDSGATIEIAGYDLNPALVAGAEAVDLNHLVVRACPVVWRETTVSEPPVPSAAATKIALRWTQDGAVIDCEAVRGPSFWAAQEIVEAPELLVTTSLAISAIASPGQEML